MNRAQIAQHQRTGSLRAQRALLAAGVDLESPIDVFGAIEREQVWLMFQQLDRCYGAYRRHAWPGIVIHSGHPHRLQRFTAAHELGHHFLGHDLSIDQQDEVERQRNGLPAQEIEAQAFAATYLMPVQLVNRVLSHLGLRREPHSVTPEQAYRISLDLGSSYSATVTQLRALDRISASNQQALSRVAPIDIKTTLALGHRPEDARADVWPLSRTDDGRTLRVNRHDELHLSLIESPTTGYRWRPEPSAAELEVAGDEPVALAEDQSAVYGADRLRHVWWRALAAADTAIGAELRRGFGAEGVRDRVEVSVTVEPGRTGDSDHGVSRQQLELA